MARQIRIDLEKGTIWVERQSAGEYRVVKETITSDKNMRYGFYIGMGTDSSLQEMPDCDSDFLDCFSIATHVRWREVDLTPQSFKAPNARRLRQALRHVVIRTFDPSDV